MSQVDGGVDADPLTDFNSDLAERMETVEKKQDGNTEKATIEEVDTENILADTEDPEVDRRVVLFYTFDWDIEPRELHLVEPEENDTSYDFVRICQYLGYRLSQSMHMTGDRIPFTYNSRLDSWELDLDAQPADGTDEDDEDTITPSGLGTPDGATIRKASMLPSFEIPDPKRLFLGGYLGLQILLWGSVIALAVHGP